MATSMRQIARELASVVGALGALACAQIAGLTGDYQLATGGEAGVLGAGGTSADMGGAGASPEGGAVGASAGTHNGAGGAGASTSAGAGGSSAGTSTGAGGGSAGTSTGSGGANTGAGGASAGSAGSAGTPAGAGGGPDLGDTFPVGYPTPITAQAGACTTTTPTNGYCPGGGVGPKCLQCLLDGSTFNNGTAPNPDAIAWAGNYTVTIRLGGADVDQTFISAESNRGLLSPVSIPAGQFREFAFVVNVREREGQPSATTTPAGYPGLDLFLSGSTTPQVMAIAWQLGGGQTKPIMVYIASDATACDQTSPAFAGWGQMLPEFFHAPVGIANYADGGASSASFYGTTALWGAIKARWSPGDWVMIQFGHYDKASMDSTVQANLEMYVADALAAGVTPILISPPARIEFASGSVDGDQSSLHAAAAQAAAAKTGAAYIDLTALSTAWYNSLGSQAAALKFHANGTDITFTNAAGATKLASLIANAIKTQGIGLSQYLRP